MNQTKTVSVYRELYLPWLVWGLAATYFLSDYFARVSPGVMLPELQQSFQVSAVGLGTLSAFFYYPYVAMQVPVGLLVDRYSIRLLLTAMSLMTAAGCFIFGSAQTLAIAEVGRFLIGFSAAFAFVSTLKLATEWFPPRRLGLLAGLTQALGMVGAAIGAAPVSYVVATVGWRNTKYIMAVIFIVLMVLIYWIVRDSPNDSQLKRNRHQSSQLGVWQSLWQVLHNKQSWLVAVYAGLIYAPSAAFGELWGVSFLHYARGLGEHSAAFANGLIFIGWAIGGPMAGWLSDRMQLRRPLMFVSGTAGLLLISIILFAPSLSTHWAYMLLFIYGLTNTGVAIAYATATEICPRRVIGASIAFVNMASVIIGAALQPVIGQLMDWYAGQHMVHALANYGLRDFQFAMWILPLCSLSAIFCVFFIRETHCKPQHKEM